MNGGQNIAKIVGFPIRSRLVPCFDEFYPRSHETWLNLPASCAQNEADIRSALRRMKQDHSVTIETRLQWPREQGSLEVVCWHMNLIFAVYSGLK